MARRSNGEGSYRRLKSGSWLGQLMDGYTAEGKKNIISVTAPTKAEAQQKLRQYLADKEAGRLVVDRDMGFSAWAEAWYKDFEGQVQDSTYAGYRYTLKNLTDYFGDRAISGIRQMDVNAFLKKLHTDGYSHSLVTKCKAMLIQIFDAAEANDLVVKNPALRAKAVREDAEAAREAKKDAFTDEEVGILMEHLPDDLIGNSIRVMLISGLRTQELLALRPEDIAEDGSVIHVIHAVKMVDGKPRLGPPKSKRSRRDIPIPVGYRRHVVRLREQGGKPFVWTSPRSESLLYGVGSFRRRYYTALKAVPDVRLLSPHCCRHTYVTRLQAKGVPLELVARLVGHSDISTTDGYTHTSLETLAGAVAVLAHDEQEDISA